jgi:hypothetical protein
MPAVAVAGQIDATLTTTSAPLLNVPVATPGVTSAPLPVVGPAEVIHVVSTPQPLPAVAVLVDVVARVTVVPGAGVAALIVRLYRGAGAVAGNLLATQSFPISPSPGVAFAITLHFVDSAGPGGNAQYAATVQQAGAPSNGAVQSSSIQVQILQ